MHFILAIITGLIINFITGGLEFNSLICIFAGIFLIMPFLLKFKLKEILNFWSNKNYIGKSLLINWGFNIIIFLGVGILFFGFSKIVFGFLLLGILSGGGLLLSWINKSGGSTKLGFQTFLIHFTIFNIIFIPFSLFIETKYGGEGDIGNGQITETVNTNNYNIPITNNYLQTIGVKVNKPIEGEACVISDITGDRFSCFTPNGAISPIVSFFILILLPFIISRIILLSKKGSDIIKKHISKISNAATFLLIGYIFTLKDLNSLLYSEIGTIISIGGATLLIYILIFSFSYYIFQKSKKKEDDITLFWLGTTRFITLGLIFSFVYSFYLGSEIMLIFIFAYFIQISFSILFAGKIKKSS